MVSTPDIIARGQQFELVREDRSLRRFGGSEQIVLNRSAFWTFSIPLLPSHNVQAKRWRAAIAELADPSLTFDATPPGYRGSAYALARVQPLQPLLLSNGTNLQLSNGTLLSINTGLGGGGQIVVNGGGQLGYSLDMAGADPGETLFRPGEYFAVNGELKVVTAQADADAQGEATVSFTPALRASPANGASVSISRPTARFRLIAPEWGLRANRLHSATLTAVESF